MLKSVYGGNDIGLKLDFANNIYQFGESSYPFGLQVDFNNQTVNLGDPDAGTNGISLQLNNVGRLIKTVENYNDIGLKLDFANAQYWIGDEVGVNSGSAIIINDINSQIRLLAGAVNNATSLILEDNPGYIYTQYQTNDIGLRLDFLSSKYELGQLTGGNQTKLTIDDATQKITITGSLIAPNITGSLQGTASWARNAISASHTLTASFAPAYLPLTGGTINGNVTVNGTASIAFLNVTIESASVIYSSGSNQLGDAINDTQTLIGTVIVSGSQQITGSLYAPHITGSLYGTASWARNAQTASYVLNAISASHAETASYVRNAQTASYVLNAISASHAESASYTVNATNAINAATASNILGGKAPHIPYFITDTTLATSSIYQSGSTSVIINQDANTTANPEALYVWQPHPTSINVISGKGNVDDYLQLNIHCRIQYLQRWKNHNHILELLI